MSKIAIGIPCYQGVPAETLEDYMRFAYYLGRRYPQHDFFLAIKSKSEQFRARNAIVEAAFQVGADYLLMLDDDMVIDVDGLSAPTSRYEFLSTLLEHLQADPSIGVIGALYYQRGGECRPVLMKQGQDGGFYWLRDDEVTHGLQEVGVAGGGCLLFPMATFERIPQPWFEPELQLGTDVQICKKARDAGLTVWADTSIELGHVKSSREVITSKNRARVYSETCAREGINRHWQGSSAANLYVQDAQEYLQMGAEAMHDLANAYDRANFPRFGEFADKSDYYRSLGNEQLARQACFHSRPEMVTQMEAIHSLIDTNVPGTGVDFGCGSAPVGFELAMRGHHIDFIDLDGTPAYEFLKWRAEKRGVRCGWDWGGPYDYALFLDSIEHLEDWRTPLQEAIGRLKPTGAIITNFFLNRDFENTEHINMDHAAVRDFLIAHQVYPVNDMVWIKRELEKVA